MYGRSALLAVAMAGFMANVFAEVPRIAAQRLAKAPTIDGKVDPAEWAEASQLEDFYDPATDQPVADQTVGYIGYTAEAIFVAFICRDSKPDGIVGREVTPGAEFNGEDVAIFKINPFGTRNGDGKSRFEVNVLNTQTERIAGGRTDKREWRGQWQSATSRTSAGWEVEMRIPWSMLNYPSGASLVMDFNLERYQARTFLNTRWARTTAVDRDELYAVWDKVSPPPRKTVKPIDFLGYIAPEYDEPNFRMRAGIDARYRVTNTLTALGSISPDFRNIEQQVAGISFTRTERYLEDSRPFFAEGRDFFNLTGSFTIGRMFYSRRIENFDFGGKAFGKLSPTVSTGALTTYGGAGDIATVAQVSKTFGPRADASAFVTHSDTFERTNTAIGATGYVRSGNFSLDTQLASEQDRHGPTQRAGALAVSYEVPKWFVILRHEEIDPDFDPSLAYIPWTDRKGQYLFGEHFEEYRTGKVRSSYFSLFTTDYRTYDGGLQQRGIELDFQVQLRNDIELSYSNENFEYANGYDNLHGVFVGINNSNRYKRLGVFYQRGTTASKPSQYTSVEGTFRVFRKLDLGLSYSVLDYEGVADQWIATASYEFGPTQSASARVVQTDGELNAYLSYRRSGGTGLDYYLILGDPNATKTTARVSIKLVYAF